MQDAYQSDDFDDTSSNDATTSESAYEEEEDDAREQGVQYTHTFLRVGIILRSRRIVSSIGVLGHGEKPQCTTERSRAPLRKHPR